MAKSSTQKSSPTSPFKRFRADFPLYTEKCLRIVTKDGVLQPFKLWKPQRIVHDAISRQRKEKGYVRAIILKARQEGVSTYTAARFFRRIHLWPHQNALVMAHELKPGQILFSIYERYYRNLEEGLKPAKRSAKLERQLWFDLPEGGGLDSKLEVNTANNKNAARGSTIHALHASELAFWENAADTWLSVKQAVPPRKGEIIIESTPNGIGNFFYDMWKEAEAGRSEFIPIFLPWWIHEEYQHPVSDAERDLIANSDEDFERQAQDEGFLLNGERYFLTPEQLWWRRVTIADNCAGDERRFRQEYPSNPRDCFLASGNCFFDEDVLADYDASAVEPEYRGNLIDDKGIEFRQASRGYLRIWEPPRKDGIYVIGADTASGKQAAVTDSSFSDPDSERGGRDFSCAWVYDTVERKYVAKFHARIAPDEFAKAIKRLGYFYSSEGSVVQRPALIAVEKNHSSGETVLRILKDEIKYPNLYYSRQINRRTNRPTPVLGWVTTGETRMPMLDDFAQAIREESVHLPCKDTIRECLTFVRGEDGKPEAQEGCHDDRVIAAAICLQAQRYVSQATKAPLPQIHVGAGATGLWD